MLLIRKRRAYRNEIPEWVEYGFSVPTLFDNFVTQKVRQPSFSHTGVSTPAVNIIETNDDFRLEMVAPGMRKENFRVELQDAVLTIAYDHEDNRTEEGSDWKYRTHEYNYHSFSRSFAVPQTVDVEKIEAHYERGILNLTLPKKEEARTKPARQIPVS
ncbi:Hsp20/alpha crystallin family protein [Ohtaekwangia kribbensis]|jgi:HSP20 family protein|uniref:Hsp20/alpha crystallin family protein n=1 Tax=Ohtaekwangia kribbensis TaxID=688913 RepID=A0ABW3JY80_9BACT